MVNRYNVLYEDQYGRACSFYVYAENEKDAERLFNIFTHNNRSEDVNYIEDMSEIHVYTEEEIIDYVNRN